MVRILGDGKRQRTRVFAELPVFGQICVANEMTKLGHSISPPEPVEGRGARRLAVP
jgi:hypothetical protein